MGGGWGGGEREEGGMTWGLRSKSEMPFKTDEHKERPFQILLLLGRKRNLQK